MKRIGYDHPEYKTIDKKAAEFVEREFNMIPSVLFKSLSVYKCREEVLELVWSGSRECPECGEDVEHLEGNDWKCTSCKCTSESVDEAWEDLQLSGPVNDWPGAYNICFWTTNETVASLAADCGFLVYEPKRFDGWVLTIDGGGYDFYNQHWIPLYLAYIEHLEQNVQSREE